MTNDVFSEKMVLYMLSLHEEVAVGNDFLTRKTNGEKILFSELLIDPPSDEVLVELLPCGRGSRPRLSQSELRILKLRLDGLTNAEVAEKLSLAREQVVRQFKNSRKKLLTCPIPDYIELDHPAIRRNRDMDILISSGYTKVSELLRDMPSDQELREFAVARGNVPGFGAIRPLTSDDLSLLQEKAAGRSNADIARARDIRTSAVRQKLVWIRTVLRYKLGVRIDMPGLFPHEVEADRKTVWRYTD